MSPRIGLPETQARIAELQSRLDATRKLSVDELAAQIRAIGFLCQHCGDCCIGQDSSVVVFPFEIRRIMAATGESWLETAEPPEDGEWDWQGNFHTLEWRIRKEKDSCKFYSGRECKIYEARPLLCNTYPFYLEDDALRWSECRGLGKEIEEQEAVDIAERLIERSLVEISEAMALLENYQDFERGGLSKNGACIIHDSEGEHSISRGQI